MLDILNYVRINPEAFLFFTVLPKPISLTCLLWNSSFEAKKRRRTSECRSMMFLFGFFSRSMSDWVSAISEEGGGGGRKKLPLWKTLENRAAFNCSLLCCGRQLFDKQQQTFASFSEMIHLEAKRGSEEIPNGLVTVSAYKSLFRGMFCVVACLLYKTLDPHLCCCFSFLLENVVVVGSYLRSPRRVLFRICGFVFFACGNYRLNFNSPHMLKSSILKKPPPGVACSHSCAFNAAGNAFLDLTTNYSCPLFILRFGSK